MCTYIHLQGIGIRGPTTMGMASSQARLLNLTSRMHQIEYKAAKIEAEKLQMANESRRAYLEYQNALEQTKIQRQTLGKDASIEWQDVSYYDLMYGQNSANFAAAASNYAFFGASNDTSTNSAMNNKIALYSLQNGKMFVPKEVETAYNESTGPSDFASRLSNYVPSSNPPSGSDTGNDNPVNPPSGSDTGNDNPVNPPSGSDTGNDNPVNPPSGNDTGNDNPVNPPSGSDTGNDNPVNPSSGNDTGNDNPVNPPSGNDNPSDGQNVPSTYNYEITRSGGRNAYVEIQAGQTEQILKVNDPIDGVKYYKVSTNSEKAKFEILDNGRIVLTGNGVTVQAYDDQKDNFIINGHYNNIDTGNGDDIVRVGLVIDSLSGRDVIQYDGNKINTGSGNDYVQNYGFNEINAGLGDDVLYDTGMLGYSDYFSYYDISSPAGVEIMNGTTETNNSIEWGMQQFYGSCQTLSLINSINDQGRFSEFFDIQKSGSNWKVTFKKSKDSNGIPITVTVKPSDITNNSAIGDKDISVLEAAIRLRAENDNYSMGNEGLNTLGCTANFHLVSKYVFGQDVGGADKFSENGIKSVLQQFLAGNISNVVLATKSANNPLGIYSGHAYSVKTAEIGKSVTLVNPHDNKDYISLSWSDFLKYFDTICLFGDTYNYYTQNINSNITYKSSINDAQESAYFGADSGSYNYYFQLYNAINEAGGCISVSDEMLHNTKYLANMLNSGFAYLKEYNVKTNEWEDTSVATNTKLQEVQDESDLRKAEAKYEADMRRIDFKDRKFDYDLAALDNERNAIKQEMETLKTVIKDNVDRTFKIFT